MIASLVCPRTAADDGEHHVPDPSGPRRSIERIHDAHSSVRENSDELQLSVHTAAIPHIQSTPRRPGVKRGGDCTCDRKPGAPSANPSISRIHPSVFMSSPNGCASNSRNASPETASESSGGFSVIPDKASRSSKRGSGASQSYSINPHRSSSASSKPQSATRASSWQPATPSSLSRILPANSSFRARSIDFR